MVRNIFAIIAAIAAGLLVNICFVKLDPIVALLASEDLNLRVTIQTLSPARSMALCLGNPLGILVGAFVTSLIAIDHKLRTTLGVAGIFLIGGVAGGMQLEPPIRYLVFAYTPIACFGFGLLIACAGRRLLDALENHLNANSNGELAGRWKSSEFFKKKT